MLVRDVKTAKKAIDVMFTKGTISGRLPFFSTTRWRDFNIYKTGTKLGEVGFSEDYWMRILNPYWQIDKNYIYFQEFIPGNEFDTRVTVIGDRAFAFRRMNR